MSIVYLVIARWAIAAAAAIFVVISVGRIGGCGSVPQCFQYFQASRSIELQQFQLQLGALDCIK
jgi:membrane protein YdbS with pleckstrin-like domain